MWLQLAEGSAFNLAVAQAVKVGSAGDASENFALVAEMANGHEVVLAEYHLPQAAQEALDRVNKALKDGIRLLEL